MIRTSLKPSTTPMRRSALLAKKPAATAKVRLRTCRMCREKFAPVRAIQPTCEKFDCKVEYGVLSAEKSEERRMAAEVKQARQDLAKRKEAIKTRSDWMKEAQVAFNAYRREWCKQNGFTTCPCCGEPLDWTANNVDAGHYRSVGSAPHMRFTPNNVWAQRKQCNRYGAGRAVDYRIGLIARIGLAEVEALEADQTPRKWTISELKEIKVYYKGELKELQGKV